MAEVQRESGLRSVVMTSHSSGPHEPIPGVLSWADDLDAATLAQAANSVSLPFVENPVALMADAHLGYGVPVGTVLATRGAIVPSAVGVDIGCGMVAQKLSVAVDDLDLDRLHDRLGAVIPAGQPTRTHPGSGSFRDTERVAAPLTRSEIALLVDVDEHAPGYSSDRCHDQFGTLGGGNHFVEVAADEAGVAWIVLHSGSRGVGKSIADTHIARAKGLMQQYFITLDDPDLAYLAEGTTEFARYIDAMHWAQAYAAASRSSMMPRRRRRRGRADRTARYATVTRSTVITTTPFVNTITEPISG